MFLWGFGYSEARATMCYIGGSEFEFEQLRSKSLLKTPNLEGGALEPDAGPCMIDSGLSGGEPAVSKNTGKADQKHLSLPSVMITSWFGAFGASD